jgi:MFS transporter, UMF1 family
MRRATAAWCLFDFANSSYTTLIVTVAFAVYFREVVVNAPDNRADQYWGIANFVAMLLVAAVSPVTGAAADFSGRKKLFLILTSLVTIAATAGLYFTGAGQTGLAAVLYVAGLACFELGYVFYNSFLPEVSTPETAGRVSGWGWAIGYIGGLACLAACYPLVGKPLKDAAGHVLAGGVRAYQISFLLVAAFYLTFAMPAFLWLEERPAPGRPGWGECARRGFARVAETIGHLRGYRDAAWFIAASLFFTDGITTIISFAGIYATTTMRLSNHEMVVLFLVLNVVAFPGSLAGGYAADRIGGKRTIVASLVLWLAVAATGAAATTKAGFWAMAVGAALGMGATQAVARSFMSQMTPPGRESEFFGFYVLSGKFASMFGPLVFGTVSHWTGSQRLAVLSLFPFFAAALACMSRIDERRARLAAGRDPATIETG